MSGSAGPTARQVSVAGIGGCIARTRARATSPPVLQRLGPALIAEFTDTAPGGGQWWCAGQGTEPPPRVLIVHFPSAGDLQRAEIARVLDSTGGWEGHRPVGVVGADPALPGLLAPRRGLQLFPTIADAVLGLRGARWALCPAGPAPRRSWSGPEAGRLRR